MHTAYLENDMFLLKWNNDENRMPITTVSALCLSQNPNLYACVLLSKPKFEANCNVSSFAIITSYAENLKISRILFS